MNSNGRKSSTGQGVFRTGILVAAAAVILSTGMVVTVREPAPPPAPTFSEQALLDAYEDAGKLRAAAAALAGDTSLQASATAQLGRTVTLLTVQEKALFRPLPTPTPTGAATESTPPLEQAPTTASASGFLAALTASANDRLEDAEEADGATARLLAAAGTGQLLEATSFAVLSGVPLPAMGTSEPVDMPVSPTTPSAPATLAAAPAPDCSSPASTAAPGALTAVLEAERQADYGYQVALPRLPGESVSVAEAGWSGHHAMTEEATALLARYCLEAPAPAAGYALGTDFLSFPARGLGVLEAGALPVYGDLVAFSDGTVREWAVRGLLHTAQRAAGWGAATGALPGLVLEEAELPPLPQQQTGEQSPVPSPSPAAAS